jgi:hypothetical protein
MEQDDSTSPAEEEAGSPRESEGEGNGGVQNGDENGKPTIDEPTGPALDPEPDEFDKQAEQD